jgi:hypothetical protein
LGKGRRLSNPVAPSSHARGVQKGGGGGEKGRRARRIREGWRGEVDGWIEEETRLKERAERRGGNGGMGGVKMGLRQI